MVDLKDAQNIEVRFDGDYAAENNYQFAMTQLQLMNTCSSSMTPVPWSQ